MEQYPEKKLNCWEYKHCGREPGGRNSHILGVCPVPLEKDFDGFHGGVNAGRACWAVAGTLCGGEVKGTFAQKFKDCLACDFHHLVIKEEENYTSAVSRKKLSKKASEARKFREPGFLKHVIAKSKMVYVDAEEQEMDSLFISMLIAWTNLCPSVGMLEGAKRLCREDLVDELMIIDAISDKPRRRAAKLFAKTVTKALGRQVKNYFKPATEMLHARMKRIPEKT
ncbi:MAG: hypothetical protein HQK89_05505 [Nitrospirae bacterium]|nr:hypothetical protein [Nitrospirota bacterium]